MVFKWLDVLTMSKTKQKPQGRGGYALREKKKKKKKEVVEMIQQMWGTGRGWNGVLED